MKRIICITLLTMIMTVTAQAKTIEMAAKYNTAWGCYNDIMGNSSINASLGTIPFTGEYGAFVLLRCQVDGADDKRRTQDFTFIFRSVAGKIKRDGDSLFYVDSDGGTRIAQKGFFSWKTVPGVALVSHVREGRGRFYVDLYIHID